MEKGFQARVNEWVQSCFGPKIAADKVERTHRFLEEAIELAQAAGCPKDEAHELVNYVYRRPVGEKEQEVGGVLLTLSAFCEAFNINMFSAGEKELRRVWEKIHQIRIKQANKPQNSPLPESSEEPKRTLVDGSPVTEDHRDLKPNGQQKDYVVLSEEERAKGFVRPVRLEYLHVGKNPVMDGGVLIKPDEGACGTFTKMARPIAETYARDPKFYSGTFCVGCGKHLPLSEFVWYGTNERVGS